MAVFTGFAANIFTGAVGCWFDLAGLTDCEGTIRQTVAGLLASDLARSSPICLILACIHSLTDASNFD